MSRLWSWNSALEHTLIVPHPQPPCPATRTIESVPRRLASDARRHARCVEMIGRCRQRMSPWPAAPGAFQEGSGCHRLCSIRRFRRRPEPRPDRPPTAAARSAAPASGQPSHRNPQMGHRGRTGHCDLARSTHQQPRSARRRRAARSMLGGPAGDRQGQRSSSVRFG